MAKRGVGIAIMEKMDYNRGRTNWEENDEASAVDSDFFKHSYLGNRSADPSENEGIGYG